MHTSTVENFVDFVKGTEFFDLLSNVVLFRGQPVQGDLLPSIARKDPSRDTTSEERRVLEQLKLQGASLVDGVGQTDLDLLVAAQHYGLKTRLLDWTSNPFAALWFACADVAEGDVYVYGLLADGIIEENVYRKDPFSIAKTRVIQPRLNDPRLVAQHAWFTLHGFSPELGKFAALDHDPPAETFLNEIRVPESSRQEVLSSLERYGVSAKTIYPDLSGLCRHLNWKYALL